MSCLISIVKNNVVYMLLVSKYLHTV